MTDYAYDDNQFESSPIASFFSAEVFEEPAPAANSPVAYAVKPILMTASDAGTVSSPPLPKLASG